MIGKRNLGKAVVLGLLLSTGMYGAVWADEEVIGGLWTDANYTTQEGNDLKIVADGKDGHGNIGIGFDGTVNVLGDKLTVESASNAILSGYKENAQVQVLANNIEINAGDNGIFTDPDGRYQSTVIIGSEDRKIQSLTINASGQGIDNKSGNVYIYGENESVISIYTDGKSGILNDQAAIYNECDGNISVIGGSVALSNKSSSSLGGSGVINYTGTTTLNSNNVEADVTGHGIRNVDGTINLHTNGVNTIDADKHGVFLSTKTEDFFGERGDGSGTINIIASENLFADRAKSGLYANKITSGDNGVYSEGSGTINIIASKNIQSDDKPLVGNYDDGYMYSNVIEAEGSGIESASAGTIKVRADNNNYIVGETAVNVAGKSNGSKIEIIAGHNNSIGLHENKRSQTGVRALGNNASVNITSIEGQTEIYGRTGIYVTGETNTVDVTAGTNIDIISQTYGISASGNGATNSVKLLAGGVNTITTSAAKQQNAAAIQSDGLSQITLEAQGNNVLFTGEAKGQFAGSGIQSVNKGSVSLKGATSNKITANSTEDLTVVDTDFYGDKYAVNAETGGTVDIKAGSRNTVYGAVYATGDETNGAGSVTIGKLDAAGTTFSRSAGGDVENYIGSAAVIDNAGGLAGKTTTTDGETGETTTTGMDVVSALYAEKGGQIQLSGINTIQTYYADTTDEHTSERAVWAYDGAKIDIDGVTNISTYSYDQSPNSGDIAIAAGTATELTDEDFTDDVLNKLEKATVNLNYKNGSSITGDILAAYGGEVNISNGAVQTRAAGEEAVVDGINIHGNLLAGNTGVLNVNLGNGGRLEGRADDYGDAGSVENSGHGTANGEGETFFNPAFSSEILTGGEVNLTMGEGSKWTVTGQSWVTSVDTGNNEHVEIDLVSAKSDLNANVQALTIGEMKGNAMFTMKLDGDRSASDMLYMKKANGEYFINLENAVTVEDMYQDGFDGLRFATVGKDSHATFSAGTYDNGVYNVEYEVGTDDYNGNTENDAYNSTGGDGQMTEAKPGNDLVDNLFKDEPQEAAAYGIMTLAAVDSPESPDSTEDMGTDTGMNGTTVDDTTNFKLIGVKSRELSDAGKTVVAMSQVNYANAIYMDRLNKRMGEARYIDGDEGLWVRIRHDRIGKSDAFRSKNTMMELGYDKRVDDREDGEHRRGFAIDYMRGTTDYHNVAGEGDVRRGGVWFYDTWLGNKGHYSDYVLKIGRLSNDFEIYARSTGEKITGDYSNFVYSASAEYGRKKDIGKDWYFEPQVQLQYAHVTDADYTTSQGTSVELDAIDSLIGRVGFRLGKDMGENNTFYIKADVLHEFLGDQDISAFDDTGRLDTTYENEGTWYDVGLGFSHQFSKGTYMFLDVEKTFGNDNEDTYQFNVGMNWKV